VRPGAVAATALGVLAGVALAFGLGGTGRFVGYAVLAVAAVVVLRLGRSGVLRSGGRTLGLRDLAPRAAADRAPLHDRSYWIPRGAALTALDGKQVVPLFTTEESARAWPGEHEATEASGATLAAALSAMGVEAAAVDPSSLEELRLGPDAHDPTSRTLWIRFGGE
jgi:hypothetical protein